MKIEACYARAGEEQEGLGGSEGSGVTREVAMGYLDSVPSAVFIIPFASYHGPTT